MAKNKNKNEIQEFLASIDDDFYLDLNKFSHFTDKTFETNELTITQLLQICESFILRMTTTKQIQNHLDVERVISLVLQRVNTCGNKKLSEKALDVITEMESFKEAKSITPEPKLKILNKEMYEAFGFGQGR